MGWYDTFRTTKINYYLVNLSFALAPLIYFYFRSITNPKKKFSSKDLTHFIPVSILILIHLCILIYDANQEGFNTTQNGYLVINFQWKYLDPIVALLSIVQMIAYLVLSFQALYGYREKIQHYFSNTYKLELNWLRLFLIIYTFLFAYYSIQIVVNATIADLSWIQEWWYYLLSGIAIIYVGIKGYFTDLGVLKRLDVQTFLEDKKELEIVEEIESRSKKIELPKKLQQHKDKIESYFKENKPYLEPDLTLVSLAKKMGTTREELSETINKGFNLKFNDFINYYRIEEFKDSLAQGKHQQLSLIGIAYECGFNSKATFNRAFKKALNTSPSEYLKTLKTSLG
ncbi:helix-turn-helix domain-containing protein [Flagellimonas sp. 2504JD1-5]